MIDIPNGVLPENLTIEQRQALIDHELQRWRRDARERAHILFGMLIPPISCSCSWRLKFQRILGNATLIDMEAHRSIC